MGPFAPPCPGHMREEVKRREELEAWVAEYRRQARSGGAGRHDLVLTSIGESGAHRLGGAYCKHCPVSITEAPRRYYPGASREVQHRVLDNRCPGTGGDNAGALWRVMQEEHKRSGYFSNDVRQKMLRCERGNIMKREGTT